MKKSYKEKIDIINVVEKDKKISQELIISIAREHGTVGKEIARQVAKKLELAFFDKEEIKNFAINNELISKDTKEDELYNFYL